MAKYPAAGRVKTRLGRAIGAAAAAALYRAFVLDLAERLAATGYPVVWAYWPPAAPFASLLPGATVWPQHGRDLGERLERVVAAAFAAEAGPVLTIGADVPHVPVAALDEAAVALRGGADVALGPAADGGYYLVGLRGPAPALFRDVAWGGRTVFETTLTRARAAGLRTHVLPPEFDVDEPADLRALGTLLARGEVALPRTAALLARLDSGPVPAGH